MILSTRKFKEKKRLSVHFNPCHDERGEFCSTGGGGIVSLSDIPRSVTGKVYLVNASDLKIDVYSDDTVRSYVEKIKQGKTLAPVFVNKDDPSWISDGNHRAAAYRQLDRPVPVTPIDRPDMFQKMGTQNMSPMEYFKSIGGQINDLSLATPPHPHQLNRYPSIHTRVRRVDPTKTTVLRQAFEREMRRRFNKLKAVIRTAIIDRDCFGLTNPAGFRVFADPEPPTFRQFDFPMTQAKKEAFLKWLKKQEDLGILETMRIPQFGQATEAAWTDVFIKDSYSRGVQRARYEMGKAGYPVPALEGTGGIVASMSLPFHVTRLGTVYGRAFDQLKGITAAMDMQISHILAQGLADGDNPISLAKKLLATIDGVNGQSLGITDSLGRYIPAERRARMLARTEIIRAHAHGTLAEAEMWGAAGVTVEVEFVNAGFKVCPVCVSLQGKHHTIAEARNIIPVHPNCKCAWLISPIDSKIKRPAGMVPEEMVIPRTTLVDVVETIGAVFIPVESIKKVRAKTIDNIPDIIDEDDKDKELQRRKNE